MTNTETLFFYWYIGMVVDYNYLIRYQTLLLDGVDSFFQMDVIVINNYNGYFWMSFNNKYYLAFIRDLIHGIINRMCQVLVI